MDSNSERFQHHCLGETGMKTIKPRKSRNRVFRTPLNKRHKRFSAPLSPKLKESHNVRSFPVRKGDTVQITRGDQRGFEGKISRTDRKKRKVFVEGVNREKADGTTVPLPIHPSKVMITRLNLDDKWRKKMLERKSEVEISSRIKVPKKSEKTEIPDENTKS